MDRELIDSFRKWIELQGLARNTVQLYTHNAGLFLDKVGIDHISTESVADYILDIKQRSASKETPNQHNKAIKKLIAYLQQEHDFITAVKCPPIMRSKLKEPEPFTLNFLEEEVFPVIDDIRPETALRDKAVLYTMFHCCLRKDQMLRLKRSDFLFDHQVRDRHSGKLVSCPVLRIAEQKGHPEHYRPLHSNLHIPIKEYFSQEPEGDNAFNLSKTTISFLVGRIREYFPDVPLHPHLFKNSGIVHIIDETADPNVAQVLAGHKNIVTTLRYNRRPKTDLFLKYHRKVK